MSNQSEDPVLNPRSLADIRSALVYLAAEMVRGDNMPSAYWEDRKWCGRFKKIYGVLPKDWHALLRAGFSECFRVLRPHGTLVFKWSEHCYPLRDVLALTPHKPLFGHRTSRSTHWCVFMKEPA